MNVRLTQTVFSCLLLAWGCNDSGFDASATCDKGTEDCRCIAEQHCVEGLVCAQGICLPKQGSGETEDATTQGPGTTGGDTTESTTSTTSGSTTTDEDTTTGPIDPTASSSDEDSDGTSGGPVGGPYADCESDPDICDSGLICLPIDPGGRVEAAMCTSTGCNNANNCAPSPSGTAQRVCLMIPPPTNDTVCVLSCASGETCPDGMSCHTLGLGIAICG